MSVCAPQVMRAEGFLEVDDAMAQALQRCNGSSTDEHTYAAQLMLAYCSVWFVITAGCPRQRPTRRGPDLLMIHFANTAARTALHSHECPLYHIYVWQSQVVLRRPARRGPVLL